MDVREKTKLVKRKCFDLGFSHVGISKSVFLENQFLVNVILRSLNQPYDPLEL